MDNVDSSVGSSLHRINFSESRTEFYKDLFVVKFGIMDIIMSNHWNWKPSRFESLLLNDLLWCDASGADSRPSGQVSSRQMLTVKMLNHCLSKGRLYCFLQANGLSYVSPPCCVRITEPAPQHCHGDVKHCVLHGSLPPSAGSWAALLIVVSGGGVVHYVHIEGVSFRVI